MVYGRHCQPQNVEITAKELENLIHHSASENILVDLLVENDARGKRLALVQDVQHHVLSGKVLHLDLHEVAENEKVTIMVPVEPRGEAVGVKSNGGVLEHVIFKLKVRALPKDLPEVLAVDVSALEIDQAIHVGDIQMSAGVEMLTDKHLTVLAVAAPVTEAEEAAASAAATGPGELEVIKEKKEDGAPAEADAKPAAGKAGDKPAEKAADKGGEKKAEKKK